jgi:hypothetical protein
MWAVNHIQCFQADPTHTLHNKETHVKAKGMSSEEAKHLWNIQDCTVHMAPHVTLVCSFLASNTQSEFDG